MMSLLGGALRHLSTGRRLDAARALLSAHPRHSAFRRLFTSLLVASATFLGTAGGLGSGSFLGPVLAMGAALTTTTGCATMGLRSAVDLSVKVKKGAPGSALVFIDGRYIGTLAAVEARGVRLPEGKHRISVEKAGYFPYDVIVVSAIEPIVLEVELLRLPE